MPDSGAVRCYTCRMKTPMILAGVVLALAACSTPPAQPSAAPAATPAASAAAAAPTPFYTTGSLREAMNAQYRADGKKVTIGMCLAQTATTFVCSGSSYTPDPYGGADKPTPITVTVTVGPDGSWIAS